MEPMVLKTGTTTVGIVCKDGIVLAADKRVTAGNYIGNDVNKIQKVTDNIALTTAGSVSDIQLMIKLARAQLKLKEIRMSKKTSVKEAVGLLAGMVYNSIRRYSTIMSVTQYIVGGVDDKGIHLYDLFPDGSITEQKEYVASGSGSVFAMGVLDTIYNKQMNVKEGSELALKSIKAAMKRDNASGNGILVYTVTKDGINKYADEVIEQKLEFSGSEEKKTKRKKK